MVFPCQSISFWGGLVVWGVGGDYRAVALGRLRASFCGLLNMVIFAAERHFHLLRWWLVCIVSGVHCEREIWVIFVFKNLIDCHITFVQARGSIEFTSLS